MNIFTYELDGIRVSVSAYGESFASSAAQRVFIGLNVKDTTRVFGLKPEGVEHIIERVNPCPLCGKGMTCTDASSSGCETVSWYSCQACESATKITTFPPGAFPPEESGDG